MTKGLVSISTGLLEDAVILQTFVTGQKPDEVEGRFREIRRRLQEALTMNEMQRDGEEPSPGSPNNSFQPNRSQQVSHRELVAAVVASQRRNSGVS
jgi:hypothetical protein